MIRKALFSIGVRDRFHFPSETGHQSGKNSIPEQAKIALSAHCVQFIHQMSTKCILEVQGNVLKQDRTCIEPDVLSMGQNRFCIFVNVHRRGSLKKLKSVAGDAACVVAGSVVIMVGPILAGLDIIKG